MFSVELLNEEKVFYCESGNSILVAMDQQGKKLIPVGCRAGGCGVCKIKVVSGDFTAKPMSAAHVTAEERNQGYALACRVFPTSDMKIELYSK